MPTDAHHPVAARRILRLALGTSLCALFAESVALPLPFIAPLVTLMILGMPLPAPSLKQGIVLVVALVVPLFLGTALLPLFEHARWAGVLLYSLALFFTFYFTARGGAAVLGTFMTLGLTLVTTVGSVSPQLLTLLIPGVALAAVVAVVFVWVAHALLSDLPMASAAAPARPPAPPKPDPAEARRAAMRSMAVVLPLALVFLFSSASAGYTAVMIKVAAMGQQATADKSREMGRSLLASTFWGGLAALIAWRVLAIWPSLPIYALLIALACLVFGRHLFAGPALHARASMVSYALVTMIIVLGPTVHDGPTSDGASAAFWTRLFLFVAIAVYGTVSVAVFDGFWPRRSTSNPEPAPA